MVQTIQPVQAYKNLIALARTTTWGDPATVQTIRRIRTMPTQIVRHSPRAEAEGEIQGSRDQYDNEPVPGREWADGQISTYFRADTSGQVMLHAMGADTPTADVGARYKHNLRCADVPIGATIWDFKGASQADGTKIIDRYSGVDIGSWTLRFDANDDTGLTGFDFNVLALYPEDVTVASVTIPEASTFKPIPAWKWTSQIKDSGGATYADEARLTSLELTFNNNLDRIKAAQGVQNDQGHIFGSRVVEGNFRRIYPDSDSEKYRTLARGIQASDLLLTADGYSTITGGQTDKLELHIPKWMVMDDPARAPDRGMIMETIQMRSYRFPSISGPLEVNVWNDIATYAA